MYSQLCPECKLIHPPVALGQCPIMTQKKLKEEEDNSKHLTLYNMSTILQKEFISKSKEINSSFNVQKFLNDCTSFIRNYKIV